MEYRRKPCASKAAQSAEGSVEGEGRKRKQLRSARTESAESEINSVRDGDG